MEKTDCTYSVFKLLKTLSALIFFIGTNTTEAQIFDIESYPSMTKAIKRPLKQQQKILSIYSI